MSNIIQFPNSQKVMLRHPKRKDTPKNVDFGGRFYVENGRLGFTLFPIGKVERWIMAALLRHAAQVLERS